MGSLKLGEVQQVTAEPLGKPEAAQPVRIEGIDLVRGAALPVLAANHFLVLLTLQKPTKLHLAFGYVTMAEVLVFMSGISGYLAFSSWDARYGFQEARQRLGTRIFRIYKYHLVGLAFTLCSGALTGEVKSITVALWQFALGSIFLYLPHFTTILPMYIIFSATLPWIFRALKEGCGGWTIPAVSVGLWLINSFEPSIWPTNLKNIPLTRQLALTFLPTQFPTLSWQILFTFGLLIARQYQDDPRKLKFSSVTRRFTLGASLFFLLVYHLSRFNLFGLEVTRAIPLLGDSKPYLGFVRVANFIALAVVTSQFIAHFKFSTLLNRIISTFGRNSLQYFLAQQIVCSLVYFLVVKFGTPGTTAGLIISLIGCFILTFLIGWFLSNRLGKFRRPMLNGLTGSP